MKRSSGRYDTNSYDTFADGDSDSYQCCYHIFSACAALCDLSRQQENAKVARTHRKVAPGYDNVDTLIYCLKDIGDNMFGVGIPRLLAVAITGGSYKLWHNTFVSMAAGTLSYMGLLYLFSHVLTMA